MRFLKIPETVNNNESSPSPTETPIDRFHSDSMHSHLLQQTCLQGIYAETNTDTTKAKVMKLSHVFFSLYVLLLSSVDAVKPFPKCVLSGFCLHLAQIPLLWFVKKRKDLPCL